MNNTWGSLAFPSSLPCGTMTKRRSFNCLISACKTAAIRNSGRRAGRLSASRNCGSSRWNSAQGACGQVCRQAAPLARACASGGSIFQTKTQSGLAGYGGGSSGACGPCSHHHLRHVEHPVGKAPFVVIPAEYPGQSAFCDRGFRALDHDTFWAHAQISRNQRLIRPADQGPVPQRRLASRRWHRTGYHCLVW